MQQETIKRFRRAIARWIYFFFVALFTILPYTITKFITRIVLWLGFAGVPHLKRNAMETLRHAFAGQKTEEELRQICKACFFNMGKGAIEVAVFHTRPKELVERFTFEPEQRARLEEALKLNKGVIGITGHFGNFPLLLLYLAKIGYPTNAIIRPARDTKIEVSFQAARASMGLKTIHSYPREACVRASLKCLRQKELLMILMDQNTGSKSGVYVEFFGQRAGTPTGAIVFAMRTGAPILPMFCVRDGYDTHRIIVEPHFYIEPKATDEETIAYNVQKVTNIIERYIRQYPQEWGWMHRRFKSKPKHE